LESLEARGLQAAGMVQTLGIEQAVVDLLADRAQLREVRECLGRLESLASLIVVSVRKAQPNLKYCLTSVCL